MQRNPRRDLSGFIILCLCSSYPVYADQHINQLGSLIDSQFRVFAENLSVAQNHRALGHGAKSGAAALDIGFQLSSTEIERDSFLESLASEQTPNVLQIPRLHISTGYNDGWNAGAFYSSVPDSDIQIYGGELRYSMTSQNRSALPSLSVRGTYSQLTGVDDLFVTSTGLELSVSKGFSSITPYAGVGTTWLDGEYQLDGYTSHLTQNKYFMGLQFNLGMFSLSAQTEQAGDTSTTKATMGVRF